MFLSVNKRRKWSCDHSNYPAHNVGWSWKSIPSLTLSPTPVWACCNPHWKSNGTNGAENFTFIPRYGQVGGEKMGTILSIIPGLCHPVLEELSSRWREESRLVSVIERNNGHSHRNARCEVPLILPLQMFSAKSSSCSSWPVQKRDLFISVLVRSC